MVSAVLLAYSSYSYSEITFSQSSNAAANGYNWVMTEILPSFAGLVVNGVNYQYTTVKEVSSDMVVTVANENTNGSGLIFSSVDDWSGIPGNSITKVVAVPALLGSSFGPGSISWTGVGDVTDASVVYRYNYDVCFDPQVDPTCPGYEAPIPDLPVIVINDPLQDEFIRKELERKASLEDEEEKELKKEEEKEKERLEVLLGGVNTTLLATQALAQAQLLLAMNTRIEVYYTSIPGGRYDESVSYADEQLADNVNARRSNFAQQLLHEKMVKSQYANLISQP